MLLGIEDQKAVAQSHINEPPNLVTLLASVPQDFLSYFKELYHRSSKSFRLVRNKKHSLCNDHASQCKVILLLLLDLGLPEIVARIVLCLSCYHRRRTRTWAP
jgi:hypothetical protein